MHQTLTLYDLYLWKCVFTLSFTPFTTVRLHNLEYEELDSDTFSACWVILVLMHQTLTLYDLYLWKFFLFSFFLSLSFTPFTTVRLHKLEYEELDSDTFNACWVILVLMHQTLTLYDLYLWKCCCFLLLLLFCFVFLFSPFLSHLSQQLGYIILNMEN